MLKGKKVLLRPVRKSDVSLFLKWFNDQEVTQYLLMYLPITEIDEEKWIEKLSTERAGADVIFVIEAITGADKETVPIGTCGLQNIRPKDRDADLGIAIGEKDYWEKGYGTETMALLIKYGFEQLNLHRISSRAIEFNERSRNLHKKLGFRQEGRFRKAMFRNNRYWDHILFGLLRKEWKACE
ncbi:MAG: GNAT family protein [Candidatus Nealsonbacteria bacterium]